MREIMRGQMAARGDMPIGGQKRLLSTINRGLAFMPDQWRSHHENVCMKPYGNQSRCVK